VDEHVRVLPIADACRAECLSDFYGIPVRVAEIDGMRVAF
jgi:hypothetical protein